MLDADALDCTNEAIFSPPDDHVAHMYTSPSWDSSSGCEWVGVSESVKIVESLTYPFP